MNKILNFTPHDVHLHIDGKVITFPSSGFVVRIHSEEVPVGNLSFEGSEIPLVELKWSNQVEFTRNGEKVSMEEVGIFDADAVIVSAIAGKVLSGWRSKGDPIYLIPNGLVRNESGQIIGCNSFQQI